MSLEELLNNLETSINNNDYSGAKKIAKEIVAAGLATDPSVAERVKAIRANVPYNDPRLNTVNVISLLLNC